MKEEERLFYEDVKEKAITARSAHKRPSHSGRTRFPYRTAKELRALNGPTYTVNLGKPITWDDFRALPENLQRDYVTNLIDKYDAGPTEIARIFGVNMKTCSSHLRRLGFKFAKGHKQSQEKREELRAAYGVAVAQAPTKKQPWRISRSASAVPSMRRALFSSLARLFPRMSRCGSPW